MTQQENSEQLSKQNTLETAFVSPLTESGAECQQDGGGDPSHTAPLKHDTEHVGVDQLKNSELNAGAENRISLKEDTNQQMVVS